jgi:hypothetical protein
VDEERLVKMAWNGHDAAGREGHGSGSGGAPKFKSIVGTFGAAPALLPNHDKSFGDPVGARSTLTKWRYDV